MQFEKGHHRMKYTMVESMGTRFLLFSLGALPSDAALTAKEAADAKEGIGADLVLFLTPSLTADLRLTAFDACGRAVRGKDCLAALGAYLYYAAGLPIYEYKIETEEGESALEIVRSTPPIFHIKSYKCKYMYTKIQINVKNSPCEIAIVTTDERYAVLLCDHAGSADLFAVRAALSLSEVPKTLGTVACARTEGGYAVRCLLRDGTGRVPLGALAACAALLGGGTPPLRTDLCPCNGRVRCERTGDGRLSFFVGARLLARGEYFSRTRAPKEEKI